MKLYAPQLIISVYLRIFVSKPYILINCLYYRPFYSKPEMPVNADFVDLWKHLSLTSNKDIQGGHLLVESHYTVKQNRYCLVSFLGTRLKLAQNGSKTINCYMIAICKA